MINMNMRRSWVEISLDTIAQNYQIYKSQLAPQMKVMAVVKADAYGHGAAKVAPMLQELGCTDFAVSNIEEAIELREAGIKGQILILGYTDPKCAKELVYNNITQALISDEYAFSLGANLSAPVWDSSINTYQSMAPMNLKVQAAIDTGMNRIGLDADTPDSTEAIIRKWAGTFNLTGMFTHLCVADTPAQQAFTEGQIEKFKTIAERVADLNLPYVHCMNSAGGLWQSAYGALARLGIILYGLKPDYANILPEGIKPALSWKSVVAMVKDLMPGETVGYGRTYAAGSIKRIATIPTGYADGYNRLLSNKGYVIIRGQKAPIVGRVCMDQMMVDVTDIRETVMGDEVTLLGEGYTADDMAQLIDSIGYEVLCDISKRVNRKYI